jgi:hypothetical protein
MRGPRSSTSLVLRRILLLYVLVLRRTYKEFLVGSPSQTGL